MGLFRGRQPLLRLGQLNNVGRLARHWINQINVHRGSKENDLYVQAGEHRLLAPASDLKRCALGVSPQSKMASESESSSNS